MILPSSYIHVAINDIDITMLKCVTYRYVVNAWVTSFALISGEECVDAARDLQGAPRTSRFSMSDVQ